MKKIIAFLFLFFMPFVVKAADIEIKDIELIEKSEGVTELEKPTFKGLNVSFNLSFTLPNDSAKYKVTIKNNSNEEYLLEEKETFSEGEYIKYSISYNDAKTIKAGEEKEASMVVTYDKEIPVEAFNDDGTYTEKNNYILDISSGEENPYTRSNMSYIVVGVLVLSLIIAIVAYQKKKALLVFIISLSILSVPFVVYGLRRFQFNVNTNIHIEDRPYVLDTSRGSFSNTEEITSITVHFDNNKYILQEKMAWFQTAQYSEHNNILVLNAFKDHFTKDSFIKVYDSETNELLEEVTYDSFPRPLYQVNNGYFLDFSRLNRGIENHTKDTVRVEVSEDLQEYLPSDSSTVYYLMYTSSMNTQTYKAPWISDPDTLSKLKVLGSFSDTELSLQGFQRDAKDSHLYHAIWKQPPTDK